MWVFNPFTGNFDWAGGSSTPNPLGVDASFVRFRDDFIGGFPVNSGSWGETNWTTENPGGVAGTYDYIVSELNHWGIVRIASSGVINTGAALAQSRGAAYSGAQRLPILGSVTNWRISAIFRLNQLTTCGLYIGAGIPPNAMSWADFIGISFDTSESDVNFQFQTIRSTASTKVDTGVAADTGWHKCDIWSTALGQIQFSIDDGTPVTISTTLPAQESYPVIQIRTYAAAAKSMDIDFYAIQAQLDR